jgi:nicotinamide-nucleotide amidase
VARSGIQAVIASKVLRTWGESESGLNERLNGIIEELENNPDGTLPTLAFLASGWEGIKVRLTARGATSDQVSQVLATWEERVRGVVGDVVFGVDTDTMESVVLQTLRSHGHTLAVAESVTGGLVTGRLTNIAGASDVLVGGVVSYASEVKYEVLNVPRGPVVSGEAAIAMARGVKVALHSSVGLALTGVAGPSEQEGQPI